jgi:N-acetylmuramoyl-L-alanine amidase
MLRFPPYFLHIPLSFCILLIGGYTKPLSAQITAQVSEGDRLLYAQADNNLQLRGIQNTSEGIALLMNGNPQIVSERAVNPDRLVIDLVGTVVNPRLHKAVIPINRYGVRQIRIGQNQRNPPIARIVLDFDVSSETSSTDWEAIFTPSRGAVIVKPISGNPPRPSVPINPQNNPQTNPQNNPQVNPQVNPQANPPTTANNEILTVIQKLTLSKSGQLLIQTNQPFTYLGTEDIASGSYNITINSARISPQLVRPSLDGSALDAIRMSQVGSSVVIGLRPTAGWRIKEDARSDPQQIYVQLYQSQNTAQNSNNIPDYLDPNNPITDPPLFRPPNRTPKNPTRTIQPRPQINPPSTVTSKGRGVLVIDPGHGGNDVGAVGNGIYEANVVLAISLKLGRILQEMGYTVVYTRTDNSEVELQPRVDLAQKSNADAFISIHANSLEARLSDVSGIETYYAPGASVSARLASFVHNQIINLTGAKDRGIRTARFHVIRRTSMPSILVETGFVTNPQESANLNNPSYQDRMAASIARGVDQFMKTR